MSTHGGDIYFGVKLDEKQYNQGLAQLDKKADKVGSGIGAKLGAGMGTAIGVGIAGALATAGAVMGLSRLATKAGELGDQIDKTSQKMGMSAKTFQEWSYVMDIAGTSIESLQMGIKTLATSAMTSKDALKELGITEQEVANLSQEDLFGRVISGLQGVTDTTKRTYLAGQLLGRGATELAPLLNMTAEETDQLRQRLYLLGGAMSDRAVQNSANFKDALTDLSMVFRGVSNAMAETLLPVITSALNNYIIPAMARAVAWIRSFVSALGALFSALRNNPIAKGAKAVKDAVGGVFNKKSQKQITDTGNAMGGVGNATKGVGGSAKKAKKEVQALKRELLGFDRITKLTKQDANTGTSGGGGAGGGIGGGGVDYSEAMSDTSAFADFIDNTLGKIEIPERLQNAIIKLGEALSGLWDTIKGAGLWCWENVLKPLGSWTINELAPREIEALAEGFNLFNNVLKILGSILEPLWEPMIKPMFKFLGDVAVAQLEQLTFNLKNINTVLGLAKGVIDDAWHGLQSLKEWLEKVNGNSNIKISLTDAFTKSVQNIKNAWNSIANKTATLRLNLVDGFSKKWSKVKKAWNSIRSKTADIKLRFTESIRAKWNSIASRVNSARAKGGLARTLLPQMPYLAQGGYVKANTPQLAMIGDNKREGEIVAPESKLKAMAEEVASNNDNAQVVTLLNAILVAIQSQDNAVYLDGRDITRAVVNNINTDTRRTGMSPILL